MRADVRLRVDARRPVAGSLLVEARLAGVPVEWCDDGDVALVVDGERRSLTLPDPVELRDAVVTAAVDGLLAGVDPPAESVECVVLAPAAGMCGPSGQGPVDAVVVGDLIRRRHRSGRAGVPMVARVVTVQHTRCWTVLATVIGTPARPLVWRPVPPVVLLPPVAGRDTASATQYLHETGSAGLSRQVAVLREPEAVGDGTLRFAAVFGDGAYLGDWLDRVLRDASVVAT
jgi:hypothetical protein